MASVLPKIDLDDKYALASGRVLLSGTQALVRLLLEQRAIDASRGLKTAGYVSGYRGSPLGGLDQQLWRAKRFLDRSGIVFAPGVNEDLAATAVWGSQQTALLPGARVEGVFALWYGKGPGLDRSGDPIKHGNRMGAARRGGVLLAVGEDHGGKSSTTAYQSEQALSANGVVVLYPANVQELLDFGLLGWAMSRYAGVWVGLKCVNDVVETTSTIEVGPERFSVSEPTDVGLTADGIHARIAFDPIGDDLRLQRYRLPAAQAFAYANGVDRITLTSRPGNLGIVTAGKSYTDTAQALRALGIDDHKARKLGIGLYKCGLTWPLEPRRLQEFARGCRELLVIEEKAPLLEPQIAHLLYHSPEALRPRLLGKRDEAGHTLFPSDVSLSSSDIALVIAGRLRALDLEQEEIEAAATAIEARKRYLLGQEASPVLRTPYFCSGCPHNTSTRVPEGSLALAGIGCHTMAMGMDRATLPPTQMGGEGMTWAGIAPFTDLPHVFQNLGDGTYFHSGLLAIRGAVAAGINITYKILINDAVAMTGGQPVEGGLGVVEIARQLRAERIHRIAVVCVSKSRRRELARACPPGVSLHVREELSSVQRALREVKGVSALIYEQTCAAELRRRRKRKTAMQPAQRVFIHPEVCEGCGDCSAKSNCVSIEPLETPFGRKRRINQTSCNQDLSCVQGFCPSFVLVEGTRRTATSRKAVAIDAEPLPEPTYTGSDSFAALIAGIGGTGVVTIGSILAMAAHLEGLRASVFDMTGLAQKGGAVLSHLRIGRAVPDASAILDLGEADLLLACDLVVGVAPDALRVIDPDRTLLVVNDHLTPVAQFQRQRDFDFHLEDLRDRARQAVATGRHRAFDATSHAEQALGDAVAANMLLTGYAFQEGAFPLTAASIERAIALNGTSVGMNTTAFRLGRRLRADPTFLQETRPRAVETSTDQLFRDEVERWSIHLSAYQNDAYAKRYRALIERVQAAERAIVDEDTLARAVARNYGKLLAYKDEYEIARLYASADFRDRLRREFEGNLRLRILLAPPFLARRDRATGEPRKIAFGAWILPLLKLLARARGLRGTFFDPFGHTRERQEERALIPEYEETVEALIEGLSRETHKLAVEIASIPESIRGFGHIKTRSIAAARERCKALLAKHDEPRSHAKAAA